MVDKRRNFEYNVKTGLIKKATRHFKLSKLLSNQPDVLFVCWICSVSSVVAPQAILDAWSLLRMFVCICICTVPTVVVFMSQADYSPRANLDARSQAGELRRAQERSTLHYISDDETDFQMSLQQEMLITSDRASKENTTLANNSLWGGVCVDINQNVKSFLIRHIWANTDSCENLIERIPDSFSRNMHI